MVPVVEHKATFCRICEPPCGMIATVEDGRLVALRPDKERPLSAGFACPKGIAFSGVVDERRVGAQVEGSRLAARAVRRVHPRRTDASGGAPNAGIELLG